MALVPLAVTVTGFAASLVCLFLAFVLLRAGKTHTNQVVAAILLMEGLTQWGWGVYDVAINEGDVVLADIFVSVALVTFAVEGPLYLLVIRRLETPWVSFLRSNAVVGIITILVLGAGLYAGSFVFSRRGSFNVWTGEIPAEFGARVGPLAVELALIMLYALGCAISAWRRSAPGTLPRSRSRAYAVAFGTRDTLTVIAILLNIGLVGLLGKQSLNLFTYPIWAIAPILFAVLLTYGILRTQLFDLELKLKVGISRSTAIAIAIIAAFVAAKAAETYLNKNVGFLAGSVAAGILLFLAPRLNRLGDKVANATLPHVQPTPQYVTFKKLEVYKAAVEAANETGGLTAKDRLALDRLRTKLGLDAADARAVEDEVVPGSALGPTPAVGA
jgi:hypothetical protein